MLRARRSWSWGARSSRSRYGRRAMRRQRARSEAPAQTAALARLGGRVADQGGAEVAVSGAVPDFHQVLLGRVAEGVVLVAAGGERGDAAGQRPAVRGEIHERPRAGAGRPGAVVGLLLQAQAGLGR